MSPFNLLLVLLMLTTAGYYLGRRRALSVGKHCGGTSILHSRPTYYGALSALWCAVPALVVYAFWLAFEPRILIDMVVSGLPGEIQNLPLDRLNLLVNDIKNLVEGNIVGGTITPSIQAAADQYRNLLAISHAALAVIVMVISSGAVLWVQRRIQPKLRARNHVETFIKYILIACSTLAIFITIGIVLSVLYEAIRFFKIIPMHEFLLGLKWSPQMAIRADQIGTPFQSQ